mgnify:CR=1 FL=1
MSKYGVGLRNVGSYMVSGRPYITGSAINAGGEIKIEFPYVTRNVTIRVPSPPNNAIDIGNQDGSWLSTSTSIKAGSYLPEAGGVGKDFTYSWWMKDPLVNSNLLLMTLFKADGSFTNEVQIRYNTTGNRYYGIVGTTGAGMGNSAVTAFYNSSVSANDGNWHHLVVTQYGGNIYFYVDGNQGGGVAYAGDLPAVIDTIKMGWNGGGGVDSATYDETTVFTEGFTQQEVTELYNSGDWFDPKSHSKASSLIAWWTMGDTALDGRPVGSFTGFPYTVPPDTSLGTNGPAWFYNNGDSTERNIHAMYFEGVGGTDYATVVNGPFTGSTSGKLRVHMLSTGSDSGANISNNFHFQELNGYNTSIALPMKTKEFYLSAVDAQVTYEVYAELTNITASHMYALTGSGIDE